MPATDKHERRIKYIINDYLGKITSTKCPFLCKARVKPVTYDAKDPTETMGDISVQMWIM